MLIEVQNEVRSVLSAVAAKKVSSGVGLGGGGVSLSQHLGGIAAINPFSDIAAER